MIFVNKYNLQIENEMSANNGYLHNLWLNLNANLENHPDAWQNALEPYDDASFTSTLLLYPDTFKNDFYKKIDEQAEFLAFIQ